MSKPTQTPKTQPRAWQRMLSGRRLNLLDPSPLDVEISDIAHGLARVARWNGQTQGEHAYSVAQHSILVLDIALAMEPSLSTEMQLVALLHDAPEYVIGDMISPFKSVMGGNYREVEDRLTNAVHMRFSLPVDVPKSKLRLIKQADKASAYLEAIELAGFDKAEAEQIFGAPKLHPLSDFNVTPLSTADAQRAFVERFEALEKAL